jgi:hypothetical protein
MVQWRYTPSLCTLWQRLGRAARDPSNEASGIYLVESQYFDNHRKEAEDRATARAEKAHKKQLEGATESERVATQKDKDTRTHKGKAGPGTRKKNQPRPSLGLPAHATNKLIVMEPRHQQDYEVAAMDTYINVRLRGICRRQVSDEFFGNGPGMLFLFHRTGILLTVTDSDCLEPASGSIAGMLQ